MSHSRTINYSYSTLFALYTLLKVTDIIMLTQTLASANIYLANTATHL